MRNSDPELQHLGEDRKHKSGEWANKESYSPSIRPIYFHQKPFADYRLRTKHCIKQWKYKGRGSSSGIAVSLGLETQGRVTYYSGSAFTEMCIQSKK